MHRASRIRKPFEQIFPEKLNFFLRMVKCNYFEKRIKGLSEISAIVESFYKKNDLAKSKITKDELKDWIIGSQTRKFNQFNFFLKTIAIGDFLSTQFSFS